MSDSKCSSLSYLLPFTLLAIFLALTPVTAQWTLIRVDDTSPLFTYKGVWNRVEDKFGFDYGGGHIMSDDEQATVEITVECNELYFNSPLWPYPAGLLFVVKNATDGGAINFGFLDLLDTSGEDIQTDTSLPPTGRTRIAFRHFDPDQRGPPLDTTPMRYTFEFVPFRLESDTTKYGRLVLDMIEFNVTEEYHNLLQAQNQIKPVANPSPFSTSVSSTSSLPSNTAASPASPSPQPVQPPNSKSTLNTGTIIAIALSVVFTVLIIALMFFIRKCYLQRRKKTKRLDLIATSREESALHQDGQSQMISTSRPPFARPSSPSSFGVETRPMSSVTVDSGMSTQVSTRPLVVLQPSTTGDGQVVYYAYDPSRAPNDSASDSFYARSATASPAPTSVSAAAEKQRLATLHVANDEQRDIDAVPPAYDSLGGSSGEASAGPSSAVVGNGNTAANANGTTTLAAVPEKSVQ